MSQLHSHYTHRTTGAIPISIGTSLALESLFIGTDAPYDPKRIIPNKIKVSDYDTLYINSSTLVRNILSSVGGADVKKKLLNYPELILFDLEQEMEIITELATEQAPNLNVVFYHTIFNEINRANFNVGGFKLIKKELTGLQALNQEFTLSALNKLNQPSNYKVYKDVLMETNIRFNSGRKSLIITHDILELHDAKKITFDLLESYTGVLKNHRTMYTKFPKIAKADLSAIPINMLTLILFGDNHRLKPYGMKIRKKILEISEDKKWTPLTTLEKIKVNLSVLL